MRISTALAARSSVKRLASADSFNEAEATLEVTEAAGVEPTLYEYLGGVAALTIPDNLRSGVTRPDRYEADINPSYRELAQHYGTCVIPARIRKPRDKAKVEAAVLVAQRWILAALRHRTFYHLNELNAAIGEVLVRLNDRVMRHVKQSRQALFERLDRPALKALPPQPYEYAEWGQARVNIDYNVSVDDHFYSAPTR